MGLDITSGGIKADDHHMDHAIEQRNGTKYFEVTYTQFILPWRQRSLMSLTHTLRVNSLPFRQIPTTFSDLSRMGDYPSLKFRVRTLSGEFGFQKTLIDVDTLKDRSARQRS